ncbi:MAG: hypothetical protein DAHOPDDO_03307 [Ignavibacteriaceae bacterium]|nr:hypothetical protein [Ignavibacteriaceae bacterium]
MFFLWQKSGTHEFKHRRYEVTSNTWGSPLPGYTVTVQNLLSSNPAGVRVTSSTIIIYYSYYAIDEYGNYHYYFNWVWRNLINNSLVDTGVPNINETRRVYSTTTFDNQSHTSFYYKMIAGGEGGNQSDVAIWRSKQSSGYPDDIIYDYGYYPPSYDTWHVNVSSAGNEVHVIWKDSCSNNGNNLRYKFDNQNPIAPQNLTMTSYNNHPKLVWQKNLEPDIDYYRIYRKKGTGNYTLLTTVSVSLPTEYVDNEETVCNPPPGAHCENEVVAKYYITAVDLTSKVSLPSNEVEAILQGTPPSKATANDPSIGTLYEYSLNQNYPNPFNPSTTISYSIKSDGFVNLKVYDMLGTEAASLVNENQEAGNYSVRFDASSLPSGIYVYRLTAKDFTSTKKLMLVK